jgi:hypothetical protein
MALTILDDTISSDRTAHPARVVPGEEHQWADGAGVGAARDLGHRRKEAKHGLVRATRVLDLALHGV